MYKRILVPLDGSSTSKLGLKEALRLAQGGNASLCLLNVVDELFVTQAGEGMIVADQIFEKLRASGRKVLAAGLALARKRGVRARTVLAETMTRPVADVIVRQARSWKADLIVLGTHGRRGVRRVVMGSDAEQVLRSAPVPVLMVRSKRR
ncbi:MAG TPA: universal stress protein [Burkholderiales bacterium]|nr:universal stress protein [Burkholderiales bacterium]